MEWDNIIVSLAQGEEVFKSRVDKEDPFTKNLEGQEAKVKKRKKPVKKKSKLFICVVCKAEFLAEDLFHEHVNVFHTDEFPYPCGQCKKRFADLIHLKTHEAIHDPSRFEGEPQHKCEFCEKSYHLKVSLATHRNLKHFGYKAPKKVKGEKLRVMLPRNKGSVKPRKRKPVRYRKSPGTTMIGSHDDLPPFETAITEIPEPKIIRSCFCTLCKITLPSQVEFQRHLNTVHSDCRKHSCRYCGKRFSSSSSRRVHETIHNPSRFLGDKKYACDFCDNKYHLESSLTSHRKFTHLGFRRSKYKKMSEPLKSHHAIGVRRPPEEKTARPLLPCPHCDLKFTCNSALTQHVMCHSTSRPYKCEVCQRNCTSAKTLRAHQRNVHEKQSASTSGRFPLHVYKMKKSWDCEFCEKQFKTPSTLQSHRRMHTGDRPHQCNICGERFRLSGGLKSHHAIHQKTVSPMNCYKCMICGREDFSRFSAYTNHRKCSHPRVPHQNEKEKAFGCGICGKPYFLRENAVICALLSHDATRLHSEMFKHKCSECPPERFGHRNFIALRKHWVLEHGDKTIPGRYRLGMYKDGLKDVLPHVKLNMVKAQQIRENGVPLGVDYKSLFVEFDLLEEAKEDDDTHFQCSVCDKVSKNSVSECPHHLP